jgi:hypothetical protein
MHFRGESGGAVIISSHEFAAAKVIPPTPPVLQKIVSGAQTGVDRAALDWAIRRGIAHGGWCPKGRRAEDGVIPEHYEVHESDRSDYADRTERNVIDSDGTAVISINPTLTGGSKTTEELALKHGKPFLHVHVETPDPAKAMRQFVSAHHIATLNVAGPRASEEADAGAFSSRLLEEAFPDTPIVS